MLVNRCTELGATAVARTNQLPLAMPSKVASGSVVRVSAATSTPPASAAIWT